MSDLFWLSNAQMARLERFFPKSHGNVHDESRPEAGHFASIDPCDPVVEEKQASAHRTVV